MGSPLLTLSGEHGPSWKPAAVNYTGTANVQVRRTALGGGGGQGAGDR